MNLTEDEKAELRRMNIYLNRHFLHKGQHRHAWSIDRKTRHWVCCICGETRTSKQLLIRQRNQELLAGIEAREEQ